MRDSASWRKTLTIPHTKKHVCLARALRKWHSSITKFPFALNVLHLFPQFLWWAFFVAFPHYSNDRNSAKYCWLYPIWSDPWYIPLTVFTVLAKNRNERSFEKWLVVFRTFLGGVSVLVSLRLKSYRIRFYENNKHRIMILFFTQRMLGCCVISSFCSTECVVFEMLALAHFRMEL